jgi:phage shock protein C
MSKFDRALRGGMYRSRNGIIMGVCRGIAEFFDFSVFWTRAVTVFLIFFTGFWPMLALYFVAGLILKPEPVLRIRSEDEQEFYDTYVRSRKGAAERIKRRYHNLNRRIERLEHSVTAREFDWESRLNG